MRRLLRFIFDEIRDYFHNALRPIKKNPRTHIFISDIPLKLLEIVLVSVFITTNIGVIQRMADANYDILHIVFNSPLIYIPIFYIFWIFTTAYDHKELISDKRLRRSIHITSALAVVISLSQMVEFKPLFEERLAHPQFISVYNSNCPIHALCCILIIVVLIYIRAILFRRKMYFTIVLNLGFIFKWWGPVVIRNAGGLLSRIALIIGLYKGFTLFTVALVILLFASTKIRKFIGEYHRIQ